MCTTFIENVLGLLYERRKLLQHKIIFNICNAGEAQCWSFENKLEDLMFSFSCEIKLQMGPNSEQKRHISKVVRQQLWESQNFIFLSEADLV